MNAITQFRGNYYFLSNFYERSLIYEGVRYNNSEAAFQAQKTLDPAIRKKFVSLNAGAARRYGRSVELRPDWEQVKDTIMYKIVLEKFLQNPDLRRDLVHTGNATLIETTDGWNDCYWGVANGEGQNKLGKILMRVRNEIKDFVFD